MTPAILTIADLCARWRCGRRAVLHKVHSGQLAAFRVGRAWRVSLAVVEQFERGMA